MGSGKSAVMAEASDILTLRSVPHAAIDLDMLGFAHLPVGAGNNDVMYRNLQAVWQNYEALGVDRLLLARAIENQAELDRCLGAIAAEDVIVCRLTASIAAMQQRVAARELGVDRNKYIERVTTLNDALDHALLENFAVTNEDKPLTEVAKEVLERAHWL